MQILETKLCWIKNLDLLISEDDTDDIANEFVDKGLLDDLYTVLENKQLYTKVGQVLAEVAKSGINLTMKLLLQ